MKRIYMLLGCLFIFSSLSAQILSKQFQVAATRPANINAIAEQADGKIIVGGIISRVNGVQQFNLSRLLPDGQLDEAFQTYFRDTIITSIAIQADQKVVVGGYTGQGEDETGFVFRLLSNGNYDPSFPIDTFDNRVQSVEVLSNQNVVVGGIFKRYQNQETDGLIVFNTDGSVNQRFDLAAPDNTLFIYEILQIGNQFYAAGNIGSNAQLYRFDLNGTRDNQFSINTDLGEADFMTSIQYLTEDENGNLVFATYTWEFNPQVITINNNGARIFQSSIPNPLGLTVTTGNQILISGEFNGRPNIYAVTQNNLTAFGDGTMADDQVYDLLRLSNGNILAAGRYAEIHGQRREALALFSAQGNLLNSFQPNVQRAGLIREVISDNDKIYIAGDFSQVNGTAINHLAKLNADGSIDNSFQQSTIPLSKPVNSMALLNDGKIIVGTSASSLDPEPHIPLNRLNPDGSKDNSFQISPDISLLGNINGFIELADGRLVVYGSYSLLSPDGFYRLIGIFGTDGSFDPSLSSNILGSSLSSAVLQGDQLILGGNNLRTTGGTPGPIIRISLAGVQDNTFNTSFHSRTRVENLHLTSNNELLVSGKLFDGINYFELTKLDANGGEAPNFSWPNFSNSVAPTGAPRSIQTLANGDLLISNAERNATESLLISDANGNLKDSVQVTSTAYLGEIELLNDSVAYLGGAFVLDGQRVSLARLLLNGIDIPQDTMDTDTMDMGNNEDLTLLIASDSVQERQNVCIPIRVENFEDILAVQLTLNYDASKLAFQSIGQFGLNGLSENDFGLPGSSNNQPGVIRLAWLEPNLNGQTLADGSVIFELCFEAIEPSAGALIDIVGTELIDTQDNIIRAEVESGTVEITAKPDDPDPDPVDTLYVKISDENVKLGDEVCLTLTVRDFEDIMGMQFSLNYDPTLLQFKSVGNFNLPGLNESSFGIPGDGAVPDGLIKLAWFDLEVNGVTVPDDTEVFEVCFTALASAGSTEITFSNVEISDETNSLIGFKGDTGQISFSPADQDGGPLEMTISDASVKSGESVCVNVSAENFEDLLGFTFLINYDPTQLQYESVGNFNLPGLSQNRFDEPGQGISPPGELKLTWFDFDNGSVTVPDGTNIFEVCFLAIGDQGTTDIDFSEITVFDENNEEVGFIGQEGTITILPKDDNTEEVFTLEITSDTVAAGEDICVQIITEHFDDILGLEFTIEYDTSLLTYKNADNFNLAGLSTSIGEPGVGFNVPGKFKVAWFDQQVEGVSLADGTVLFEICFTAKDVAGTSDITFTDAEITGSIIDDVAFNDIPGSIVVEKEGNGGNTGEKEDITFSIIGDTTEVSKIACLEILVKDFEDVQAFAFDINYDPALLEYQGVLSDALSGVAASVSSPGILSITWIDAGQTGISLADGTLAIELCFLAKTSGISSISISNGNAVDTDADEFNFISEGAFVTIEDASGSGDNFFTIRVASDTVAAQETFCLEVSIANFTDVLGVKLNLNYDPSIISFESIGGFNLKGLDERSFDIPGVGGNPEGIIRLSWLDQDLSGVSLPDGTVIFELCFKALTPNSTGTISMSDANILDVNGNVLIFVGIEGTVMIEEMITTSVDDIEEAGNTFQLFPVPATSEITVNWTGAPIKEALPLQIVNTFGQVVLISQLQNQQQRLYIDQLPAGHYYLMIRTEDRIQFKPFIKR